MKYATSTLIAFLMFAGIAKADSVSVTNEVHLRASSGGNSVSSGGTVQTGSVTASVDIENDDPVEDIHTYISTTTTSSVRIYVQNGTDSSNGKNGQDGRRGGDGSNGSNGEDGKHGFASVSTTSSHPHTHPSHESATATRSANVHASTSDQTAVAALALEETSTNTRPHSITHSISHFFEELTKYVWSLFTK